MRQFRLLIAAFSAVCLAFAGAIGISPVLHQLIEHGYHGPVHSLSVGVARVATPTHNAGHDHPHDAGLPSRLTGDYVVARPPRL